MAASKSSKDAWKFCKGNSRCIEVFYLNEEEERVLTKVHFQYDKEVRLLYVCDMLALTSVCFYPVHWVKYLCCVDWALKVSVYHSC